MKNQILDMPIRHSFPDFLGKGETIIWEGEPCFNNTFSSDPEKSSDDYSDHIYWASFFVGLFFIAFILKHYSLAFAYFLILLIGLKVIPKLNQTRNGHYKYAITQKQILFRLKEKWWHRTPVYHAIPFSEIKDIIIIMRYDLDKIRRSIESQQAEFSEEYYTRRGLDKIGSIIIVPHHPQLIPFETRDLVNNNKRHQPSMELLKDVKEVAKIIQEGIRTNAK